MASVSSAMRPLSGDREQSLREHLADILNSPEFRSSPRCSAFLRHVVDKALAGKQDELKERLIGAEVFGRDPGFETAGDSIVRVKATEVRRRLAKFYQAHSPEDDWRIDLPAGSYVPAFQLGADEAIPAPAIPRVARNIWLRPAGLVIGLTVAVGSIAYFSTPVSPLNLFWAPLIQANAEIVICPSANPDVIAQDGVAEALAKGVPPEATFPAKAFTFSRHPRTSWSTVLATLDIDRYLTASGRRAQLRPASDLPFDQLRKHSLITIGMFSNPWTMELNRELRFSFERIEPGGGYGVRDAQAASTPWRVSGAYPMTSMTVDYALITRLLDSKRSRHIVAIGGISGLGTQVAADFVSTPAYWNEVSSRAPRGWHERNIQILLETRIVKDTPSPPKILAVHVW